MTQLPDTNRLVQLEAQLRSDCAEAARRLWRIGNALLEVRREELWRHRDCTSFNDWLHRYSILSRATAYRAIQVAEQFSGEQAALYGSDKLSAASHYLSATRQKESPGELSALNVRVRDETGAWEAVPFNEASAETIRAAARAIKAAARMRQVPKSVRKQMTNLSAALPTASKRASSRRVSVSRHGSGRLLATFKDVPVDEIPAFIAALQAFLAAGDGLGD